MYNLKLVKCLQVSCCIFAYYLYKNVSNLQASSLHIAIIGKKKCLIKYKNPYIFIFRCVMWSKNKFYVK